MSHISEYEVETKFIDRLESIGYEYIELKNYDDVLDNSVDFIYTIVDGKRWHEVDIRDIDKQ